MASQNQHPIDKQIASIAFIHGLDIVTRNSHDFAATGVKVINPFRRNSCTELIICTDYLLGQTNSPAKKVLDSQAVVCTI